MTDHLKTMGAKEVSRNLFLNLLQKSISQKARFVKPEVRLINKALIESAEQNVASWD